MQLDARNNSSEVATSPRRNFLGGCKVVRFWGEIMVRFPQRREMGNPLSLPNKKAGL